LGGERGLYGLFHQHFRNPVTVFPMEYSIHLLGKISRKMKILRNLQKNQNIQYSIHISRE